ATVSDANISPQMREIILHAIQKDPDLRYQSAMEFLEALEQRETELVGGSFKTTMLDVRETGMVYEAARVAQAAQKSARDAARQPHPGSLSIPTDVSTRPVQAEPKVVYKPHPAQQNIIARQRTIIIALSAAFGVMTLLALAALFILR